MHHSLARSSIAHRHPTQPATPPPRQPWRWRGGGRHPGPGRPRRHRREQRAAVDRPRAAPRHRAASYPTDLLAGLLILGIGAGLVFPAASVTAMRDVTAGQAGLASGLMMTVHEVGVALGVALVSVVAAALAVAAPVAVSLVRPAAGVTAAVP
jgi:hypothetical protein